MSNTAGVAAISVCCSSMLNADACTCVCWHDVVVVYMMMMHSAPAEEDSGKIIGTKDRAEEKSCSGGGKVWCYFTTAAAEK